MFLRAKRRLLWAGAVAHRRLPHLHLPTLALLFTTVLGPVTLHAQDFGTSPTASPQNAQRSEASAALEAHDFSRALKLLTPLAAANPRDSHLLYDLAAAEDALDQTSAAQQSYRIAIEDEPNFLAPHVALGLLLARNSKLPEARAELITATTLSARDLPQEDKLLQARAFRALARLDSKARPTDARDELLAALKLSPETPEDTLLSAELAQATGDGAAAAETAYRRLLSTEPDDPEATASLAHLLVQQKRQGEAETLLTKALAAHPEDPALTLQLAAVYAAGDRSALALPLIEPLHRSHPADASITHFLANLYLQSSDYLHAEPLLAELCTQNPQDLILVDDRADALIHLKRFAEAQQILTAAVARPALFPTPSDLSNAAGRLAFAASENNDPAAVLQAVALRATVSPPSATILFLAAISHDKLNHVKLAQQAYQRFLGAAKGTLPDQEFEARHRLIALEHRK